MEVDKRARKRKRYIKRLKRHYVLWMAIAAIFEMISALCFFACYGRNGIDVHDNYFPPTMIFGCAFCIALYIALYKYTKALLFDYANKEEISFMGGLLNKWRFMRIPYIFLSVIVIAILMIMMMAFFITTPGYGDKVGFSSIWSTGMTALVGFCAMATISTATLAIMSLPGVWGFLKRTLRNLLQYAFPFIAFQFLLMLATGLGYMVMSKLAANSGQVEMMVYLSDKILEQTFETSSFAGFFRGPLGIVTALTSISVYDSMFDRIKEVIDRTGEETEGFKKEFLNFWDDKGVRVSLLMTAICVVLSGLNAISTLDSGIWVFMKVFLFLMWCYLQIVFLRETSYYDLVFNAVTIAFLEQCLFSNFDFSELPLWFGYGLLVLIIVGRVCLYIFFATGNGYIFQLLRATLPNLKRDKRETVRDGLDESIGGILWKISRESWKEVKEEEIQEQQLRDEIEEAKTVFQEEEDLKIKLEAGAEVVKKTYKLKRDCIVGGLTVIGLLTFPLLVILGWTIYFIIWKRKHKDEEEGL